MVRTSGSFITEEEFIKGDVDNEGKVLSRLLLYRARRYVSEERRDEEIKLERKNKERKLLDKKLLS